MKPFKVGVVCSGNTCRSPVAGAWLRQILDSEGLTSVVKVWTAGMNITGVKVPKDAQEVALEIGMSEQSLIALRKHRAKPVEGKNQRTDLIVWFTDPKPVGHKDRSYKSEKTRGERIVARAKKLKSWLLVITEPDAGYDAEQREKRGRASREEVLAAYREQGINLGQHMKRVARFIHSELQAKG